MRPAAPNHSVPRRDVLRALGGVGVATLTGAAGCLEGSSGMGSNDDGTGTTTDPPDELPRYVDWVRETNHQELASISILPTEPPEPALFVASGTAEEGERGPSVPGPELAALRLEDGTERWTTGLQHPARTRPLHGGDEDPRLYLATGPESLHGRDVRIRAFDPTDGEHVWDFDSEDRRFLVPLVATDETLLVGRRDDQIGRSGEFAYGLDAADGTKRWRVKSGDVLDEAGSARFRDTFFLKTRGAFRALEPASGDERWRVESAEAGIDGPAFGSNGERVFVGHDSVVRALSVSDGGELWRREFDFTTTTVTRPQSGASTTLYVGDYDGRLLALSPREGETRWELEVDGDGFYPTVQRTSSTVYVGGAGVHAVDPVSGERQWSFGTDTGPGSHVTANASTTVFALERGENKRESTLSALNPDTGEQRWEFTPDGDVTGIAAAGSVAFLGVGSTVYGLDGSAGE